mmetsp:Transcript_47798/g.108456  ORF Transcript_47798/g.108456 Transcript_47798/m.108456 type:complete len:511 (+) Transcript_47798:2211-3743(+)
MRKHLEDGVHRCRAQVGEGAQLGQRHDTRRARSGGCRPGFGVPFLEFVEANVSFRFGLLEALLGGNGGQVLRRYAHRLAGFGRGLIEHLVNRGQVARHLGLRYEAITVFVEKSESCLDFVLPTPTTEHGKARTQFGDVDDSVLIGVKEVEEEMEELGSAPKVRALGLRALEVGLDERRESVQKVVAGKEAIFRGLDHQKSDQSVDVAFLYVRQFFYGFDLVRGGMGFAHSNSFAAIFQVPGFEFLEAQSAVLVLVAVPKGLRGGGDGELLGPDLQLLGYRRLHAVQETVHRLQVAHHLVHTDVPIAIRIVKAKCRPHPVRLASAAQDTQAANEFGAIHEAVAIGIKNVEEGIHTVLGPGSILRAQISPLAQNSEPAAELPAFEIFRTRQLEKEARNVRHIEVPEICEAAQLVDRCGQGPARSRHSHVPTAQFVLVLFFVVVVFVVLVIACRQKAKLQVALRGKEGWGSREQCDGVVDVLGWIQKPDHLGRQPKSRAEHHLQFFSRDAGVA